MLNEIIDRQKDDVAQRQKRLPLSQFYDSLVPSDRKFKGGYIFECKYRSPSGTMLNEQYPIELLAKQYAPFADAISVLTNAPYFGGSFTHLRRVRAVVDKPVLCKDFILSPYQVALARLYGADAILLMLSVLNDEEYLACRQQALDLHMEVLTEVHTLEELHRAKKLKANIIGINHRSLHTLQLDMGRVAQLAPHFPKNTLMIAESGIQTHQQIQQLRQNVQGFLIGSALSKSENVALTIRELRFGTIKICGLTRAIDATHAFSMGASLGGLIFSEHSLRCITLAQAHKIIQAAPLQYVGVFTDQNIDFMIEAAQKLQLHAVQLHQFPNHKIALLREKLPPDCQIWQAFSGNATIPHILPPLINKMVVDNGQLGGTGKSFHWDRIENSPLLPHILLAGGLCRDNIRQAKALKTWGLDINSGVETQPGIKDRTQLEELFNEI